MLSYGVQQHMVQSTQVTAGGICYFDTRVRWTLRSTWHGVKIISHRLADMEWPPGRYDISRIIDHISLPPQHTSVQEVFTWLLAGYQL